MLSVDPEWFALGAIALASAAYLVGCWHGTKVGRREGRRLAEQEFRHAKAVGDFHQRRRGIDAGYLDDVRPICGHRQPTPACPICARRAS